ncbi:MAG: hypothetical protein RL456_2132 [Pseudomonadota bacterium]|jgi:hypothetical protein
MAEISEDDWRMILEAWKSAHPGQYPDRSQIIDEMVRLYVAMNTALYEKVNIVGDNGTQVAVIRPIGGQYPISLTPGVSIDLGKS